MAMYEVYYHLGNPKLISLALVSAANRNKAMDRVRLRVPGLLNGNIILANPADDFFDRVYTVATDITRVKVKITKASPDYWYSKRVGDEFEGTMITEHGKGSRVCTNLYDIKNACDLPNKTINGFDCEIISLEAF